jgi:hypothetical protein
MAPASSALNWKATLPQWQLPLYSISIFLSLAGAKARWPGYPFRKPNGCLP